MFIRYLCEVAVFTVSSNEILDKVFLLKKQMPCACVGEGKPVSEFVLCTWNLYFLRYMNNNIILWFLNIFQAGCKEITAYFFVSVFILFTLLMKKIKGKWIFLTLKPAFAVNLQFPQLTTAHSVNTSSSKSLGFFLSFLLCIYFPSDIIKI